MNCDIVKHTKLQNIWKKRKIIFKDHSSKFYATIILFSRWIMLKVSFTFMNYYKEIFYFDLYKNWFIFHRDLTYKTLSIMEIIIHLKLCNSYLFTRCIFTCYNLHLQYSNHIWLYNARIRDNDTAYSTHIQCINNYNLIFFIAEISYNSRV